MSIFLLLLGCFILFGKSRYFPDNLRSIGMFIKKNKLLSSGIGYLFLVGSYIVLSLNFGWGTGFILWLLSLSLCYSLLVLVLPLNKRYVYFISLLFIALIIFENTIS